MNSSEVDTLQTAGEESNLKGRVIIGKVVSNKMDKTVVVEVVRKVRHKLYQKYMKVAKKFHAHDDANVCQIGDTVKIVESRPLSKTKTWMLTEVLEKAK